WRREGPRRHDEYRRPVLGWQRNVAGIGWRRSAGRLPAGVLGDPQCPVPAGFLHADCTDLSRRGLRVPFQGPRREAPAVGSVLRGWIRGGDVFPGCDAGGLSEWDCGGRWPVCWRRIRLADAVLRLYRLW